MSDPKQLIVRKQIQTVEFGFYVDADVRSRSVVEITSPQAFDAMGTALPRGLYDPRLGPYEKSSMPCVTCGCGYLTCPGHASHLELAVPVYHPILFPLVLKFMKAKCLHCHRLRLEKTPMMTIETKFMLLHAGRLQECLELDTSLAQAVKTRFNETTSKGKKTATDTKYEQILLELQATIPSHSSLSNIITMTSYEREQIRILQKEAMSMCLGSKKCPHCGAFSPKIRQDSFNKIFQAPLSATNARINTAEGIILESALIYKQKGRFDDNDDDEEKGDLEDTSSHDSDQQTKETDKFMHSLEVEAQVQLTWARHPSFCHYVIGPSANTFFMRAIPVPPARFRPPMLLGSMTVENGQNAFLNKMLITNDRIRSLLSQEDAKSQNMAFSAWIDLQTTVNCFMDSSKDPSANTGSAPNNGIRQVLEKKEGIFRKHMMGKRVDFCCRSVISPDPYVGTNEIGIPLVFAKTLTYPTPVSDLNVQAMRELVIRGPHHYPGASWVQFPDGRRVELAKMGKTKREAISARLLALLHKNGPPVMVGRQLRNGDMMLVNRQPTLHKPGIMAHVVRVLHNPTQKTIRMHYANCNTYNADFDGDEMNCHFPQNDLATAESKYIAATDLQYIAPTDGTPLRGLIQDHVDAGVKLCAKNTFLEKWQYQQLLFAALASLPGLEVIRMDAEIELMPPTIMKPRHLWTGKQVISTVLNHLRKNNDRDDVGERKKEMPGISVEHKAKTPEVGFGASEMEHLVVIRDGELLRGVLDKNAYGATDFSLVHAVYEAYGPAKAGLLLNLLGRLFTAYLQYFSGHSCRMEDLILTQHADTERRKLVERAYNIGARSAKAWADSEGGKVQIEPIKDKPGSDAPLKPVEAAATAVKIGQLLSGKEGQANFAALDGYMQSQLNPLASEIIKACLPNGLNVPFPDNTFSLMVTTGAKGSTVNQSQVSCALGQQALEGRRVPRLASGRTLPSFAPYDPSPRADGFIMDRFLTGVRPQEYYFHCMAGREGLVDTAVKTSRSGYLQRCLVKHLEELKVCYDSTVRNGEGGVVQFLYGEDGLDPTKAAYLDCTSTTFEFMARNHASLSRQYPALPNASIHDVASDCKRLHKLHRETSKLISTGNFVHARKLRVGSKWARGAFCQGWFDATVTKSNDDGTFDLKYTKDNRTVSRVPVEIELSGCGGRRTEAISSTAILIKPGVADPILSGSIREDGVHRVGTSGACVSEKVAGAASAALKKDKNLQNAMKNLNLTTDDFGSLIAAKYGSALVSPGEAVGCIAAQSVGEPSTQMTLNTFHLAGAGANVTLGIPRLREIIMTASRELKTPTMSVPLKPNVTEKQAIRLTRKFTKLTLGELIAGHNGVIVNETLEQGDGGNWERAYHVTLTFHPPERIKEAFGLNLEDIAGVIMRTFKPKLAEIMKRELKRSSAEGDVVSMEVAGGHSADFVDDDKPSGKSVVDKDVLDEEDADDDDDEAIDVEDGVNAARFGSRPEETYDDMDDDDRVVAASVSQGLFDDDDDDDDDEEHGNHVTFTEDDVALINKTDEAKLDPRRNSITLPSLRVDPAARPLLMVGLIERAATSTLVRSRPLIDRAFINDEEGDRGRCLQTAGCNFSEFWALENVFHNKLASNDIWAIRCAYGVEAARNNIVEQIRNVFGAYGICVDPRHLSLIADYMTFDGGFKPMNRNGMADVGSPFLQMSFETTAGFMTEAALNARVDACNSPSANIVVGRPIKHGTGAFDVLTKS